MFGQETLFVHPLHLADKVLESHPVICYCQNHLHRSEPVLYQMRDKMNLIQDWRRHNLCRHHYQNHPEQWFQWQGTLASKQPGVEDNYALITLTNGKQRKQERYWGAGFLSQSPFLLFTSEQVKQIEYFKGIKTGSK